MGILSKIKQYRQEKKEDAIAKQEARVKEREAYRSEMQKKAPSIGRKMARQEIKNKFSKSPGSKFGSIQKVENFFGVKFDPSGGSKNKAGGGGLPIGLQGGGGLPIGFQQNKTQDPYAGIPIGFRPSSAMLHSNIKKKQGKSRNRGMTIIIRK